MPSTMRSSLFAALVCVASLAVSGCGLLVAETSSEVAARLDETIPDSTQEKASPVAEPEAIAAIDPNIPTVIVTRYKIDNQCNNLIPEDLSVPAENSLDEMIGEIVSDRSNGDFRIAGYRINRDEATKTLTLDFRLPIDSPRSIYSLSHCEQFALLGELRETLIANSEWNIETVNFKVQGQDFKY